MAAMQRVLGTDIVGGDGVCLAQAAFEAVSPTTLPTAPPTELPPPPPESPPGIDAAVLSASLIDRGAHRAVEEGGSFGDGATARAAATDEVASFVEKWQLDEQCALAFKALSPEVQSEAAATFSPGTETRNVSAKFISWLRVWSSTQSDSHSVLAATSEDIGAFAERWSLDEQSTKLVKALPVEEQTDVLARFNPEPGTRNVCAKLAAFIRVQNQSTRRNRRPDAGGASIGSVSHLGSGGSGHAIGGPQPVGACPPSSRPWAPPGQQQTPDAKPLGPDPVAEFTKRWNLDDECSTMLRSLPESVQHAVFTGFAPAASTRNPNGKLHAYARSKLSEQVASGQVKSAASGRGAPAISSSTVQEFVAKWALDDDAAELIRKLPADVGVAVIATFNPPAGTQNVSARFHAFVRTKLEGNSLADPVKRFVGQWGLDSHSEALLRSLSSNQLNAVVAGFAPAAETWNLDGKLVSFVKSLSRGAHAASGWGDHGSSAPWGDSADWHGWDHWDDWDDSERWGRSVGGGADYWSWDESSAANSGAWLFHEASRGFRQGSSGGQSAIGSAPKVTRGAAQNATAESSSSRSGPSSARSKIGASAGSSGGVRGRSADRAAGASPWRPRADGHAIGNPVSKTGVPSRAIGSSEHASRKNPASVSGATTTEAMGG